MSVQLERDTWQQQFLALEQSRLTGRCEFRAESLDELWCLFVAEKQDLQAQIEALQLGRWMCMCTNQGVVK